MFTELLNIATCAVVLASLWIRRRTWRYKWEQPKTFGLTLMAVGTFIKVPPVSWLLDRYVLNGVYLLIAHVFILSGIAAIAYSAERKLRSELDICRWRVKFIVIPWSVAATTMVGMFVFYRLAQGYTVVDWLVYDVMMIYFLSLCAYSLWCLFYDPPSRAGAGLYLFAVGWGLIAATCRAATISIHVPDEMLTNVSNTSNAVAISLFAGGAAWMWRLRLREMNHHGAIKRSLRKM